PTDAVPTRRSSDLYVLSANLREIASPGAGLGSDPVRGLTPVRLYRAGRTAPQQRIQEYGAKSGRADAVKAKCAQLQGKITGAQDERHRRHDEVAVVAEVDLIHYPDPGARHRDQTKNHDRHAAQDRPRYGLYQSPELG